MRMIRRRRVESFGLSNDEFIQSIDISFRAGHDDVSIRAVTAEDARVRNFALRIHRLLFCHLSAEHGR